MRYRDCFRARSATASLYRTCLAHERAAGVPAGVAPVLLPKWPVNGFVATVLPPANAERAISCQRSAVRLRRRTDGVPTRSSIAWGPDAWCLTA